jgi:hypothetical protein
LLIELGAAEALEALAPLDVWSRLLSTVNKRYILGISEEGRPFD